MLSALLDFAMDLAVGDMRIVVGSSSPILLSGRGGYKVPSFVLDVIWDLGDHGRSAGPFPLSLSTFSFWICMRMLVGD